MENLKTWHKSGAPWIWLNAGAVSISIVLTLGLLFLIAVRGLGHFWPKDVFEFAYQTPAGEITRIIGEIYDSETVPAHQVPGAAAYDTTDEYITRYLVKTGNRDVSGLDFMWLLEPRIQSRSLPNDLLVFERREWGNFYGFLVDVRQQGRVVASGEKAVPEMEQRLRRVVELHEEITEIEKHVIGSINYTLEKLRLTERALELKGKKTALAMAEIESKRAELNARYETGTKRLEELYTAIGQDSLTVKIADGQERELAFEKIVDAWQPNAMNVWQKSGFYIDRLLKFMLDDPREANTEGGVFPAIFGTVIMVLLMSVIVTPFGVIAAVYLREYAKQGALTRLIRIAVNNLAGVPSIVYGVFGLGFFIYLIGGTLDQVFFPEALPAPTFGTGGLMWASLTLAILTVPVVIVATEEGLARIPRNIREGSLALGATKIETLWRTVLPMASPAIMTGVILAIARAAGEVAPLMLVGVVKLAPSLPLDANAPFVHLERKFMHLGFHIYDVGFQSPNVEAARPLVYATALLLVLVTVILNLAAITIRNHLREKYRSLEH